MNFFYLKIFFCSERTEAIDVVFSSSEHKAIWEKSFLEAKKALCKFKILRNLFIQF